jgi:D-alanyl-D-alanine carboxypeptidase
MSSSSSKRKELEENLQGILQQGIDLGVPGFSAAIFTSSGPLWTSTAGHNDLISSYPLEPTHLLGIGSITKVFTTVVTLQLIESGQLSLSTTVGSILPPSVLRDIDNASTATIESLLSHTSGIDSWEDDPIWIVEGRGSKLDQSKTWGKAETLDYIRRLNPSGPKPGSVSYSNSNFTILGLIIEKLISESTESEIRKRILEPCGIKSTVLEGFENLDDVEGKAARRYHWATETFREMAGICPSFTEVRDDIIDATGSNLSVEWVTGGIISTPSDLCKFALAIRDGKLLKPESLAIMKDWRGAKGAMEVGHGLFRFTSPKGYGKWLGHFGSVLGYTGALLWAEEGDCVVSCLANVGTMHAGQVPSNAADVVVGTDFLKFAAELALLDR